MERSAPWSISRLSETSSLLDFRHTLGNDSVLQCALHQFLNGSYWYSVASSKRARPTILSLPRVHLCGAIGGGDLLILPDCNGLSYEFHILRRGRLASMERFILPIKPARSWEFNPFHRKHHKASNASSERRSNKTAFG